MSSGYIRSIEASSRLSGKSTLTPLLRSPLFDDLLGCKIYLKAENLQRTGSFKFRGAYNKLASLTSEVRSRGVVTFSSGNHGQAVAHSAQLFQIPATVFMPSDAPMIKVANARLYGADIVFYDREKDDRLQLATEACAKSGATLVPPFDDVLVMAGQGKQLMHHYIRIKSFQPFNCLHVTTGQEP
jgi:threonine dehydratase